MQTLAAPPRGTLAPAPVDTLAPDRSAIGPRGMTMATPLAPNTVPLPTAPTAQTFTEAAPTPTAYGDFTGPDPTQVANDPYYQFRLSEGLKQQQRGAASRGSLLTGGFQKSLMNYGQGLASEEAGKSFDRAFQTYGTNRTTNDMNFGHEMDHYNGSLAGFNANTNAALGYGRLALDTQGASYDQGRQDRLDAQDNASMSMNGSLRGSAPYGGGGASYDQQVEQARLANDQELAVRQRAARDDAYRRAHMTMDRTMTPQQLTNRRPYASGAR